MPWNYLVLLLIHLSHSIVISLKFVAAVIFIFGHWDISDHFWRMMLRFLLLTVLPVPAWTTATVCCVIPLNAILIVVGNICIVALKNNIELTVWKLFTQWFSSTLISTKPEYKAYVLWNASSVQLLQFFKIWSLKCIRITTLTFLGHVTSSVTWSFNSHRATSCRCSTDTNPPFWAACKILSLLSPRDFEIIEAQMYLGLDLSWVLVLTFLVTWRRRSRDHSFRGICFPIGGLLTLSS